MTYCKQLHISHKKTCMTCMVPRKELNHWGKRDKVTRLTSDPALQCRPQQISICVIMVAILVILFAAFLFSMGEKYLLCLCTNFWGRAGSAHKLSRLCVWTWSNEKREKSYSQSKTISQNMLGRKFSLSLKCLPLHHTESFDPVLLKNTDYSMKQHWVRDFMEIGCI